MQPNQTVIKPHGWQYVAQETIPSTDFKFALNIWKFLVRMLCFADKSTAWLFSALPFFSFLFFFGYLLLCCKGKNIMERKKISNYLSIYWKVRWIQCWLLPHTYTLNSHFPLHWRLLFLVMGLPRPSGF